MMKKKNKVVLVNPPLLKGSIRHQLYLLIGLAYLAAVLEEDENDVSVIDCQADQINHDKLRTKLAGLKPDLVGITSMAPTIQSALLAAAIAKDECPNATVVLGGPHATFMDKEILKDEASVDVIVRGEGEYTLRELVQNLFDSQNLHEVKGITFRDNGKIVRNPDRPLIKNLDELPRPSYKHFQLEKYQLFGRTLLPVISSRGCPFQCSFCVASRMFGKSFRARSPKNIVDELEWLRDVHGAEAFTFYDDTLTFDKKRMYQIVEEIKKRNIGIPWDCQTRVDQVSKDLLVKMREANCQQVFFGVESGCQKILDAVHKKTTVEQNEKAIKWAKETGLFVTISAIIGYPGETRDTIKQTLDFIKRVKPDDVYLCVAAPFPGTELREIVEKKGYKTSANWQFYDTITPVFENPELPTEEIRKIRKDFYDSFYSPMYILRQSLKKNSYSRMMARTALNHLIWRIKSRVMHAKQSRNSC
jgi:anaerobic magnesium-protoporphyrin IX monomethyl ester cyclase